MLATFRTFLYHRIAIMNPGPVRRREAWPVSEVIKRIVGPAVFGCIEVNRPGIRRYAHESH